MRLARQGAADWFRHGASKTTERERRPDAYLKWKAASARVVVAAFCLGTTGLGLGSVVASAAQAPSPDETEVASDSLNESGAPSGEDQDVSEGGSAADPPADDGQSTDSGDSSVSGEAGTADPTPHTKNADIPGFGLTRLGIPKLLAEQELSGIWGDVP